MNKNDLVQKLSERTALSKIDAQKAVDGIFDVITDSLKAGEEVRVTGFGVFVVSSPGGRQRPQSADRRGNHHQGVQGGTVPGRQAAEGCPERLAPESARAPATQAGG